MNHFMYIDTVNIKVEDLEKTVTWYTKTMGFQLLWRDDYIACIDTGNRSRLTFIQRDSLPGPASVVNIYTDNVEKAHEYVKTKTIDVSDIRDYGSVRLFVFSDTEGNKITMCQY